MHLISSAIIIKQIHKLTQNTKTHKNIKLKNKKTDSKFTNNLTNLNNLNIQDSPPKLNCCNVPIVTQRIKGKENIYLTVVAAAADME